MARRPVMPKSGDLVVKAAFIQLNKAPVDDRPIVIGVDEINRPV
jgi:hypothetical protein